MYNITYNNKQITNSHNLKLYKNSTEKIQQTIISKVNNELLVKIYIKTTLNNMFISFVLQYERLSFKLFILLLPLKSLLILIFK